MRLVVAIVGVYSPAAVERKLRDVGKAEFLLVPFDLTSKNSPSDSTLRTFVEPNPCAGALKWLRQWFLYPAKLPCRANALDPMRSLQSFITDHYVSVEQVGSWWVLRRISSASTVRRQIAGSNFAR